MNDGFLAGLGIGGVIAVFLSVLMGGCVLRQDRIYIQNDAVSAGVGKWTVDEKTGEKQFVFFNPPDDKTGPITKEEIDNRNR